MVRVYLAQPSNRLQRSARRLGWLLLILLAGLLALAVVS